MGLLDYQGAPAGGGLLDPSAMMPQQGQPMAQPGADGALPPMPPQLLQAIAQIKGAPPEQQQQFVQHIMQTIASMNHDPAKRMMIEKQFMQAMGQQG